MKDVNLFKGSNSEQPFKDKFKSSSFEILQQVKDRLYFQSILKVYEEHLWFIIASYRLNIKTIRKYATKLPNHIGS